MKTNVITVDEAIKNGSYKWDKRENDCDFYGIVPGYICGWSVECENNGEIHYCPMTCTNNYDEILLPEEDYDWNELGISVQSFVWYGWEPTGNIVFRGYFVEKYIPEEREEYIVDASKEVVELFKKYVVGVA